MTAPCRLNALRTGVLFIVTSLCVTLGAQQPTPSADVRNGRRLAERLPRLEYRGGPFVRRPRVITITFSGDDPRLVSRLEQFGHAITRSAWWRSTTDGYCATPDDCVGDGRSHVAVRLDEQLPDSVHAVDISAILRRHASAGRLGTLDSDSLLLVYLPKGVSLRDAFIAGYCGDGPRAFHRALRFDAMVIGYAVLPRCSDEATLTSTASHELLEMALGPDTSRPAFAFVQTAMSAGFTAAGREAMDPCGFITSRTNVIVDGFAVRRAWSNRAALQGGDPCVPARTKNPYVAVVPEQPTIRLLRDGESVTVGLEALANRPLAKWRVSAIDLTGLQDNQHYVDVAIDKSEVAPGDTATLQITRRKAHAHRLSVIGILSTTDTDTYLWPLAVVMR